MPLPPPSNCRVGMVAGSNFSDSTSGEAAGGPGLPQHLSNVNSASQQAAFPRGPYRVSQQSSAVISPPQQAVAVQNKHKTRQLRILADPPESICSGGETGETGWTRLSKNGSG